MLNAQRADRINVVSWKKKTAKGPIMPKTGFRVLREATNLSMPKVHFSYPALIRKIQ